MCHFDTLSVNISQTHLSDDIWLFHDFVEVY